MNAEYEKRLLNILAEHPWFMLALDAVSDTGMPQGCIGGGIIRNIVFDHLNGNEPTPPRDVDVAYFDLADFSREQDQKYETRLRQTMPDIPWEVTNQAAVHLWFHKKFGYRVPAIKSIGEAVSTWPETCTAVAVTKQPRNGYKVHAPFGLEDLFNMVVRWNPMRCDVDTYKARIAEKKYGQHWELVEVIGEK